MDFKDRQREAMRLAARIESKAAEANSEAKSAGGKEWEANSEAKSAGGKEWEPEFLFFYRCHTSLFWPHNKFLSNRMKEVENFHFGRFWLVGLVGLSCPALGSSLSYLCLLVFIFMSILSSFLYV